jgi:hypothetical protein
MGCLELYCATAESNIQQMSVKFIWLIVPSISEVSLLIFFPPLDDGSIGESGLLKSSTINVLGLSALLSLVVFFFFFLN